MEKLRSAFITWLGEVNLSGEGEEGDWKTTICQRLREGLQPAFGRYNMDGDKETQHRMCPRLAEAVRNQKIQIICLLVFAILKSSSKDYDC